MVKFSSFYAFKQNEKINNTYVINIDFINVQILGFFNIFKNVSRLAIQNFTNCF